MRHTEQIAVAEALPPPPTVAEVPNPQPARSEVSLPMPPKREEEFPGQILTTYPALTKPPSLTRSACSLSPTNSSNSPTDRPSIN